MVLMHLLDKSSEIKEIISKDDKDAIVAALAENGVTRSCSSCDGRVFSLIDGYFAQPTMRIVNGDFMPTGNYLYTVTLFCNKCGHLSSYSLAALGLMDNIVDNK